WTPCLFNATIFKYQNHNYLYSICISNKHLFVFSLNNITLKTIIAFNVLNYLILRICVASVEIILEEQQQPLNRATANRKCKKTFSIYLINMSCNNTYMPIRKTYTKNVIPNKDSA